MEGLATAVIGGLDGLDAQLLLVIPAALGVAALRWGAPVMVRFFKSLSK